MLTINNLENVFERVIKETEGKHDTSRYIMRYNSLDEMLKDFDMTIEEVQENSFKWFNVSSIQGAFIVSDYSKEDFIFLISDNEEDIQEFIDRITAK